MAKPKANPSNISFHVEFPKGHNVRNLHVDAFGIVSFTDEQLNEVKPLNTMRETSYKRTEKRKVQTRVLDQNGVLTIGGLHELAQYDAVFPIDANRREGAGGEISIACFIECRFRQASQRVFRIECPDKSLHFIELHDYSGNPEMLAILRLANELQRSPRHQRVAFITDSELGRHDAINAREEPIYGAHFLPPGCTLLYASTDTGAHAINRLLRFCDRNSSAALDGRHFQLDRTNLHLMAEEEGVSFRFLRRSGLSIENSEIKATGLNAGATISVYRVG